MSTNLAELQQVHFDAFKVRRVVEREFRGYIGSLDIRLWDGIAITLGRASPVATVVVHTAKLLRELAWRPDPFRLAEAYVSGETDVEGDPYALLRQKIHLQSMTLSIRDRLALFSAVFPSGGGSANTRHGGASDRRSNSLQANGLRQHTRAHNREAIAFHYDVSNHFYRLWLDEQMVYSCAYFHDFGDSLDQAQYNKLDHVCRKLRLKAGERLLDIGCGWGALICWAAQHYGVSAHGITLSREQYDYTQNKIRALGLEKSVTVELQDYRDLSHEATFDKVSSIGMFEHVGLKNLPTYFRMVGQVLKPGGLFLNHGITSDEEGWKDSVSTEFIQRYVFPDGELDSVSNVQRVMEQTGFGICDVEALRAHSALTLRRWVGRLEEQREEALTHVSEST